MATKQPVFILGRIAYARAIPPTATHFT